MYARYSLGCLDAEYEYEYYWLILSFINYLDAEYEYEYVYYYYDGEGENGTLVDTKPASSFTKLANISALQDNNIGTWCPIILAGSAVTIFIN